ncbi:MAG TPA: MarR family transcriptional regulator [Ktedonobacteraceae bacterium]|nr:MarR family transcriptional regulator [Ktedonobacteraceae bacterium]
MTIDNISSAAHNEPVSSRPDHDALRVWLRLLSCTTLIENLISSRLRGEFDTTLPRFDVMAQLARFPDGLLMSDLSQRLMVSNGNITGIIDNLERDGFVERILLPEDRRARKVRLTDKGRAAFDQMAVTHEGWIHDWLSSLSVDEQQVLYTLLGKLKHGMSV